MKLLDKTSKELLDKLISDTPNRKAGVFFYEELDVLCGISNFDLMNVLDELEDRKLIKQARLYGEKSIGIALTHKGVKYREMQCIAIKEFLFNSVMIPIVIAFLTALATTILS